MPEYAAGRELKARLATAGLAGRRDGGPLRSVDSGPLGVTLDADVRGRDSGCVLRTVTAASREAGYWATLISGDGKTLYFRLEELTPGVGRE